MTQGGEHAASLKTGTPLSLEAESMGKDAEGAPHPPEHGAILGMSTEDRAHASPFPDGRRRSCYTLRLSMNVKQILHDMVAEGATDIIFSAGTPPCIRVQGVLRPFGNEILPPLFLDRLLESFLSEEQRSIFSMTNELDLSLSIREVGRFRVNVYRQKGACSIAMRCIRNVMPTLSSLHMPPVVERLADQGDGLVCVTGPSGSGKSTTLAAMVNRINQTRPCHVVTIEDPIEYVHDMRKSLVEQREIGTDTVSYSGALKHVMRQAPDVVVVGEMTDLETMAACLRIAETGHLVLTTLATKGATQTLDRIIEVFPSYQTQQVRTQLSWVLRGIVSQQLLPMKEGKQMVPACEVLIMNPAVAKLLREGKTYLLPKAMSEGKDFGMQSMDDAIAELLSRGLVAEKAALHRMNDPRRVRGEGDAAPTTKARELERQLYDANPDLRRKAEASLKQLQAQGDREADTILKQFSQFYVTNFEEKKIGLRR